MDLLVLENWDLSCFVLSLIFLTLLHAQLWWLSSSAAHSFTGRKLFEISHQALLPPDCFQQLNSSWQINARCVTSISWSNPTLPCLCVLWWTLASTNCRFSYLPVLQAAFIRPQTSLIHTCLCSLFYGFGRTEILTAFFSITTALPGDKHATVRLYGLPQTASLFDTSFWQTSLWYKDGQ